MSEIPLEFIAMKMAEAHARGAAAERASIVAFIRLWAETESGWQHELVFLSDAISRGDHARLVVAPSKAAAERGEHAQPEPARRQGVELSQENPERVPDFRLMKLQQLRRKAGVPLGHEADIEMLKEAGYTEQEIAEERVQRRGENTQPEPASGEDGG